MRPSEVFADHISRHVAPMHAGTAGLQRIIDGPVGVAAMQCDLGIADRLAHAGALYEPRVTAALAEHVRTTTDQRRLRKLMAAKP